MPRSNVHAERARAEKVAALGEYLWERLTPQERRSEKLVDAVAAFTPAQRAELARRAEQRVPSDESWEQLLSWLRLHQRWARQEAA